MSIDDLFKPENQDQDVQTGLNLDDGSGLRVVNAQFLDEQKFHWDLFQGYDTLRVLTYSASINAILRMLEKYSFVKFECVFGYQGVLRDIKDILSFQKVVVEDVRVAVMGLKDDRYVQVLEKVHAGKAHFYVVRKQISHAKLYLLSNAEGHNRVIVGSANLSERAFSGNQPETLVKFDDDIPAWNHYNRMFDQLRDTATDEIELPKEKITNAQILISETPVMKDKSATLVIETPSPEEIEYTAPVQISRVEKIVAALGHSINAAIPPIRQGRQKITPEIKREISRINLVKSVEEAENRYFSIDRVNRQAILTGKPMALEVNDDSVKRDASLIYNFFSNYEGAFEGDVPRLQSDYFTLMSWLYFSPFICDMRSIALLQDSDIIRFPSFAIIFGKSNCGKTSLVDTLMTSMFGYAHTIDKQSFTAARLRGLQQAYKRFPVVFDDIGRNAFLRHGRDIIKDEMQPPVTEYPGFILSMNAEPQTFPDEIVKRSMMIYTTTALPQQNEQLRQTLQQKIQELRRELTTNLYRQYLITVIERLEEDRLPNDWLELSSGVLYDIISKSIVGSVPQWCRPVTWLGYADKRYDRVKARLNNLLRQSTYSKSEGEVPNGWKVENDKVIVWEQRDAFGRRGFEWDDVPSTLIDADASGNDRTVLYRQSLEQFLGRRLHPRRWWTLRSSR